MELRAGLTRVLADTPVRTGFAQAMVGASSTSGPFARVEAGVRPWERLAGFGFGEVNRDGWQAGVGARVEF